MDGRADLARLLAGRNEPSILEKEAHWEDLRRRIPGSPSAASWHAALLGGLLSLTAATAVFVLVAKPGVRLGGRAASSVENEFASRGSVHAGSPQVRLSCVDSATEREVPCAVGGTLVFEYTELPDSAKFHAAFARASDGVILWYFPGASQRSLEVDRASGVQKRAVSLGAPHAPGTYDVYSVFSREPLTRDQIKGSLGQNWASNESLVVVKRRIVLREHP